MQVFPTEIADVKCIRPEVFRDARGCFLEAWNRRRFAAAGIDADFVQDNCSHSLRGVLRGLHYQLLRPQGKLVGVLAGTIFDVSVDLRQGAATFGRCTGLTLSAERTEFVWIPPGFAHGFLTLSETATVFYKCTDYHAPEHERAILWNDPDLAIPWPLPEGAEPLLSPKDRAARRFRDAEYYV